MAALPSSIVHRVGAHLLRTATANDRPVRVVTTGYAELDAFLPDGGLPRGAVTELAASQGLGFSTSIALASCAAAQKEARLRGGESAFCAFLDPSRSLNGPGAEELGVDLRRLLVVRPPVEALARIAARVVASRVFSVVVIDTGGVPGATLPLPLSGWANVTRRIALAAEGGDTAVLLLTHRELARPLPLPVAMRLELSQPGRDRISVRIAKERRGMVRSASTITLSRTTSPDRALVAEVAG
jgi:hypothetical protein